MQSKNFAWRINLSVNAIVIQTLVLAVDARDALSRALTTAAPSGKMLGQELAIPVDVLQEAPCNDDAVFRTLANGVEIVAERLTSKKFYVWCDDDCANSTFDPLEAVKWCLEFHAVGRETYIADDCNQVVFTPPVDPIADAARAQIKLIGELLDYTERFADANDEPAGGSCRQTIAHAQTWHETGSGTIDIATVKSDLIDYVERYAEMNAEPKNGDCHGLLARARV